MEKLIEIKKRIELAIAEQDLVALSRAYLELAFFSIRTKIEKRAKESLFTPEADRVIPSYPILLKEEIDYSLSTGSHIDPVEEMRTDSPQTLECIYQTIAKRAAIVLLQNKAYQFDMQLAKEKMLVSLLLLTIDNDFLREMKEIGIDYVTLCYNDILKIRDDIWQQLIKIMDVVFYVTHHDADLQLSKETFLEYCRGKYRDLIDDMLLKKYIPPINPHHYGYVFWSSRLGQFESLKYVNHDDIKQRYINDVIASKYYARILCGWRLDEIRELTEGHFDTLNILYDLIRHDAPKQGYEALSQFYWEAHSRAYACNISKDSKVKLFIQDSLQEDNFFFRAELPIIRQRNAAIDAILLKKNVQGISLSIPITNGSVEDRLTLRLLSLQFFKEIKIITTHDGSLLTLRKNNLSGHQDYTICVIRIGRDIRSSTIQPGYSVSLSKLELLHLFKANYDLKWHDMGSIDTADLAIRRTTRGMYNRSKIKVRGIMVDMPACTQNKDAPIPLTTRLSTNPLNQYCVYTAYNTPKSSLLKAGYEKLLYTRIEVISGSLSVEDLPFWVDVHEKNDVLYCKMDEQWKKVTVLDDSKHIHIESIARFTELSHGLNTYKGQFSDYIKIMHAHHQLYTPSLFGARFFIRELMKSHFPHNEWISCVDAKINSLKEELRASDNQQETMAYIIYDMCYELNKQWLKSIDYGALLTVSRHLETMPESDFKSALSETVAHKRTLLRPNFYARRTQLTLAAHYWPESYSMSMLSHLRDADGDYLAIYRDRYNILKKYIQNDPVLRQEPFGDAVKKITVEHILKKLKIHLIKYIAEENLYKYEIDREKLANTGEIETIAGLALDKSGKQNLIVLTNGKLYVGPKVIPDADTIGLAHSSFTLGKPATSVGSLRFEEGKWILDNTSGHYEPGIKYLGNLVDALIDYGMKEDQLIVKGQIPHQCIRIIKPQRNTGFTSIIIAARHWKKRDEKGLKKPFLVSQSSGEQPGLNGHSI